jgi:signal peptidase I
VSVPVEAGERSPQRRRARWQKRGLLVVAWLLLSYVGASVMLWQVERFAMKAYRIPSSGMEPALHCARPAAGCEVNTADRIFVVRFLPFWTPSRGDIVVFGAPESARRKCGAGGTFVKRIIGLPGEQVSIGLRRGAAFVSIDGERLDEPYIENTGATSVQRRRSASRRASTSSWVTTATSRAARACSARCRATI